MPNRATIPFFLLDSPLKKEEHRLHGFGAGLKISFSLLHLLKIPETMEQHQQNFIGVL